MFSDSFTFSALLMRDPLSLGYRDISAFTHSLFYRLSARSFAELPEDEPQNDGDRHPDERSQEKAVIHVKTSFF
jgi:hypothetical protein